MSDTAARFVLNYSLARAVVANPDGSSPAEVTGCTPATGPGITPLGNFERALDFAPNGRLDAALPILPDVPKFCFRLSLKTASAETRQNLMVCSGLPVSIVSDKGSAGRVRLTARVQNFLNGWTSVVADVAVNAWVTVDVAYDMDTLALFVNEQLSAVAAFPAVHLTEVPQNRVTLGGAGLIAALQIIDGIPAHLENALDARRNTAEWHISLKANEVRPRIDLGQPAGNLLQDSGTGSFTQSYQKGVVFFDPADGQAAEMHGAIYELWRTQPILRSQLGDLQQDELSAGQTGARKSVFETGAIFWSAATGAVPMVGQRMVSDYIKLGEAAHPAGLPKSTATAVNGGVRQELQNGVLFFNAKGQTAFVLHGAIAAKYASSGNHTKWGFPVTDASALVDVVQGNRRTLGHSVRLEKNAAVFLKSGGTEAFLLHGDFLKAYLESGGAQGSLGLPTSDVETISATIKHAAFEHGAIVQIGSGAPVVIPSFTIYIERVSTDESETVQGENDLYMHFYVRENGHEVYHKRYPASGEAGGDNIVEPKLRTQAFNPANPSLNLSLDLDVWESDWGNDDHIGEFKKDLNIGNLWGLLDKPNGIFKTVNISDIKSIDWSVQPEVNEHTPFDFWNTGNPGTPEISKETFAMAFRDVDSEPEWYSPADWLRRLYYELAVKDIAAGGNCFGLSTEAIYAWKDGSLFGRPLSRFNRFEEVASEVNIKHCYQLGAEPILWFLKQLATLNTRDPKDVFQETRDFFKAGLNPVLCLASDWKFSKAHCVMPIAWDDSVKPWKITVFDPNRRNTTQLVTINPDNNTFDYLNGEFKGGSGLSNIEAGHLHYMPWSVLCRRPVTPVGALLDLGLTLIIGEAATTSSIADPSGKNLFANLSPTEMAGSLFDKFISIPGMDSQDSMLKGQLLIRPPALDRRAPTDFSHQLQGMRQGELSYALRSKRQAFQLQSTIEKSEKNTVRIHKLGSAQQMATLQSPSNKLLSLTTEQKLGAGNDFVRVDIGGIPVKAGLEAQLSFQPGGNSLDIVSGSSTVNAQINISGSVSGQLFKQVYDARLEGGTRLIFSHARSSNLVKIGRIDQVLGSMTSPVFLRKR